MYSSTKTQWSSTHVIFPYVGWLHGEQWRAGDEDAAWNRTHGPRTNRHEPMCFCLPVTGSLNSRGKNMSIFGGSFFAIAFSTIQYKFKYIWFSWSSASPREKRSLPFSQNSDLIVHMTENWRQLPFPFVGRPLHRYKKLLWVWCQLRLI